MKAKISADCARAYGKACAHLDSSMEVLDIVCEGKSFRAHFRAPKADSPVPAVLIMCGSDVFKEDGGRAAEVALDAGLAAPVMYAPGIGENSFSLEPALVKVWIAPVDTLMNRPDVDAARVGAFGISRGGYSVIQLVGSAPEKVLAVVSVASHCAFEHQPEWRPASFRWLAERL